MNWGKKELFCCLRIHLLMIFWYISSLTEIRVRCRLFCSGCCLKSLQWHSRVPWSWSVPRWYPDESFQDQKDIYWATSSFCKKVQSFLGLLTLRTVHLQLQLCCCSFCQPPFKQWRKLSENSKVSSIWCHSVLALLDLSNQFMVKVDWLKHKENYCSSQQATLDQRLKLYAFFFCKDPLWIGTYEQSSLLRSREGSGWTFWSNYFCMDNLKNLKYICTAKCLNSWQARWAFFLSQFRFTFSFYSDFKNIKPVYNFHKFWSENRIADPVDILPASCILVPVMRANWSEGMTVETWTSCSQW